MDYETLAGAFYGEPAASPPEDASLLGGGQLPDPPAAPEPQATTEPEEAAPTADDRAEAMYGMGPDQVPDGGHYPEVESLYSNMQREDRLNDEEVNYEEFAESSNALREFAVDAGMGRQHVSVLMDAAKLAMDTPIAPENLPEHNERVLSELRSDWGKKFDENLAYAQAEATRLAQSVPYAQEVLMLGAGSNREFIKVMADSGRARARRSKQAGK